MRSNVTMTCSFFAAVASGEGSTYFTCTINSLIGGVTLVYQKHRHKFYSTFNRYSEHSVSCTACLLFLWKFMKASTASIEAFIPSMKAPIEASVKAFMEDMGASMKTKSRKLP